MSEALSACPFCGGRGHVARESDPDGFGTFYTVKCASCGAETSPRFASSGNDDPQFYAEVRAEWNRRAPTSAAGATKPNDLTSSPEPAPALRAAEWVETANRLTEELETAAILYGDSEPGSIDESNDQHRMSAAREALREHLSRASGLLPVAREGLSDEQIKERCKAAGIQWIEPVLDDDGDGYPGGFDMTSMEEMRALLAPASGDAPGEAK